MKAWHHIAALVALAVAAGGGCSSSGAAGFGNLEGSGGEATGNEGAPTAGSSNGTGFAAVGSDASAAALPPEIKEESSYESPVATGNVIWIANPTSGLVAYIDAATFSVQTIQAGDAPTYVAAIPAGTDDAGADDAAIVLNVVSQDATLLRRDAQGNVTTTTFPSTADANSWAVSASGRWAIAWTDSSQISDPAAIQTFQDIAVMDLSTATPGGAGKTTFLTVGVRPSQIAFEGDDKAFAVAETGISSIDLGAAPVVTAEFPLSAASTADSVSVDASSIDDGGLADAAVAEAGAAEAGVETDAAPDGGYAGVDAATSNGDAGAASGAPDVSFTPDGSYALIRRDGLAAITIVSLSDGTLTTVPLPSAPTDLTLSHDGTFALAVLRDTSTVAELPIPGIVSAPSAVTMIPIPGQTIGRAIVTPDDQSALLFTTVDPTVMALTVLELQSRNIRTIGLFAPVLAVFPMGDSQNAVVLNDVVTPAPGALGAYSLVPIAADLPVKLVSRGAEPTAVAIAPNLNDRAVIALSDTPTGTYELDLALWPSLQVIPQTLASPPIAAGIAAGAERGYAAQDYPDGRITFVDLYAPDGGAPGAAQTITGFDLSARIVEGKNP